MSTDDRYRSRRFHLVAVSCAVYTALLVGGYIDQSAYVSLQVMTLGAYIAGNGVQKFTDAKYNVSPNSK